MKYITDYALLIVSSLCKEPDMVKVSCYSGDDDKTILDIAVPEASMGAVIGKNGKNAKSIRTLIETYAYLHNLGRLTINIDSF